MTSHDGVFLEFSGQEVEWGFYQSGNHEYLGGGSIFRLVDLVTAWKEDRWLQSATKLLIAGWDPQEGVGFHEAFEKLCKLIPQCMPKLEKFGTATNVKMSDAKIALMLHCLPNIKNVGFPANQEDYPLTFHFLGQMDHLRLLSLVGVDSLGDDSLARLLQSLPNLEQLFLWGCKKGLRQTFRQIGNLQQLKSLRIESAPQKWFMPADFHLLADSVEGLPNLRKMRLGKQMRLCLYQPEACLEPLLCALGAHANRPRFRYPRNARQYTGDPEANQSTPQNDNLFRLYQLDNAYIWRTIKLGPTMDQVLKQEIRKGNLQLPQDKKYDGNLDSWFEAMIAVKDIQCKGADRWDCFHFLSTQLPPNLLFLGLEASFGKKPAYQFKRIPNLRRPLSTNDNEEVGEPSPKRMRVDH